MEGCRRQARLILSNYLVYAATKLIELAGCDKEPVARQACLDILEMKSLVGEIIQNGAMKNEDEKRPLDPKALQTIMRVLAERKEPENQNE